MVTLKPYPVGPSTASSADAARSQPGELALAFVNTRSEARDGVVDALGTPRQTVGWLHEAGLLPMAGAGDGEPTTEGAGPADARRLMTEAHRLRQDVTSLFVAVSSGAAIQSTAEHGINRVLAAGCRTARMSVALGTPRLEERVHALALHGTLAPIARSAVELVMPGSGNRLRRCASPSCGHWFFDTSKGGRRRWCSMAICGNRAKAARHRERLRRTD